MGPDPNGSETGSPVKSAGQVIVVDYMASDYHNS